MIGADAAPRLARAVVLSEEPVVTAAVVAGGAVTMNVAVVRVIGDGRE